MTTNRAFKYKPSSLPFLVGVLVGIVVCLAIHYVRDMIIMMILASNK
ncbi:hypothetical protein SAMN05444682_101751 [Parapedobacter indicus]|uniref:Uncharacterized protein n=1 Tax=Parapedobacter indicus TaxID=1477437 RepID=A0A1I3E3K6_9SPHI|nr:hypothetical protein CLV26_101765 [Parapedobacter indicus]SFH93570.1 hypothetical protein SAMN05444682_101751 [Parapedobacter indicus]